MNIVPGIGWALTKLGEVMLNKMADKLTQTALIRVGLFDATCEKCNTTKTGIVIPEGKSVPIKCSSCGHSSEVHISDLQSMTIQHAGIVQVKADQASINTNVANIVAGDVKLISQSATIHIHGAVHFVGQPSDPTASNQVIDAKFTPDASAQAEQNICELQEKVARLERRLDHQEGMI